jgi:hypothetical protein
VTLLQVIIPALQVAAASLETIKDIGHLLDFARHEFVGRSLVDESVHEFNASSYYHRSAVAAVLQP